MIVESQKLEAERLRVVVHVHGYLEMVDGACVLYDTNDPDRRFVVKFSNLDLEALQKVVAKLTKDREDVRKTKEQATKRKSK